ncbi:MAG TPA: HD domain-containing phosphohydrolase [Gemmatimonadales bacterium]
MSAPVEFLNGFAQAMSALALYPEGHTSRERAMDLVYGKLLDLLGNDRNPTFSFLGDEVIYGDRPLREMRAWDWSRRLSEGGVQRLQFDPTVTRDELEDFLDQALARLTLKAIDTAEARQMRPSGIRFGSVGIYGEEPLAAQSTVATATMQLTLGDEADAVRWMHKELVSGGRLPIFEAEAVVRGLSVAMHGDQQLMVPLLQLRQFDEYTTTHCINVSVLAMALAEWLGMGARDVRAFGVAGLMHDLGKVKVPEEILNKKGKLTDDERAIMSSHTTEGARLIISSEPDLDLAAVVAYEHHIMINGGGYPSLRYPRDCHKASKLVHVCDVYDALRTKRPYRDAWPSAKVLAYVEERSGVEFDGEIAHAFTRMMQEWEPRVAPVTEDQAVPAA